MRLPPGIRADATLKLCPLMHNRIPLCSLAILTLATLPASGGQPLFENADFEKGTLENWTPAGDAFTHQPTKGDNTAARNRESAAHQGQYWIGTFENYDGQQGKPGDTRSDKPTGTLTSVEFTVSKRYITFRIGAGDLPKEAGVKLLCEGREHFMSSGFDSETMEQVSFDAAAFVGKKARIQIFDNAKGGWGHTNADEFTASDEPVLQTAAEFKFTPGISASGYPDIGYDQPLRPQFHFCSRKNWLNDPNGMVFDGEKYHLFFQHNPNSTAWGNMTWGHAVSTDMLRWKQLDHALLPYQIDRLKGTIFSGTAVVDHNNSLGVQAGDRKTLAAFYTFANNKPFYQALAYSTDGGTTWQYHNDGRAVVPNQGFDKGERDPKVFWHEPSKHWVMALWVQSNPGRVRFFTSKNLKDWEFASDLMRDWAFECMDVIFTPVDGDASKTKCVIYDASFDYEIGTFDGKAFHTESAPLKISRGNFYAAQSFYNAPGGRTVQIGWMQGGANSAQAFGVPHNQQMAFPCDLTLRTTPAGVRLVVWPIKEIASLVTSTNELKDQKLTPESNLLAGFGDLDLVDLSIEFEPGTATEVVIDLPRTSVRYDVAKKKLSHSGVDDKANPVPHTTVSHCEPRDGRISLRLLLDRLSLEAYAFGGESFGAHYIHPHHGPAKPSIHTTGGEAKVISLTVRKLKSAWQ